MTQVTLTVRVLNASGLYDWHMRDFSGVLMHQGVPLGEVRSGDEITVPSVPHGPMLLRLTATVPPELLSDVLGLHRAVGLHLSRCRATVRREGEAAPRDWTQIPLLGPLTTAWRTD